MRLKRLLAVFLLLASLLALVPSAFAAEAEVVRLWGNNRAETSAAISRDAFEAAETCLIADGSNYPDALAGVSLAHAMNAPILLVSGKVKPESAVFQEISRLGAADLLILGGENAVKDEWLEAFSGLTIDRLSGEDRFETAVLIAERLLSLKGNPDTLFFASSEGFADALSVGAAAAMLASPVLYLPPSGIPDEATAAFIEKSGAEKAVILGGENAVSPDAEAALAEYSLEVSRLWGSDRYATCLAVLEEYDHLFDKTTLSLASGLGFPDALTGAVWSARNASPLLLAGNKVKSAVKEYFDASSPEKLVVFGGTAAVASSVVNALFPGAEAEPEPSEPPAPPEPEPVIEHLTYGTSGSGKYPLEATRIGDGKNVMLLTFALHGWEDHYAKDGKELVSTADSLEKYLTEHYDLVRNGDWSVYICRLVNPDGLYLGTTCDGKGRCTTTYITSSGSVSTAHGVDLNRSFDYNWEKFSGDRNFNGDKPLAAVEARALAGFAKEVKGKGYNIAIDTHGWLSQIITNHGKGALYEAFLKQFPDNTYASLSGGKGYFASWAGYSLGYDACLFEFPKAVTSHDVFVNGNYAGKYRSVIVSLLRNYHGTGASAVIQPADTLIELTGN